MKMTMKQFCANCVMFAGAITAVTGAMKSVIDLVPKGCMTASVTSSYNPNSRYHKMPAPPPPPRNIKTNQPTPAKGEPGALWWSFGPAMLVVGFLVALLGKRLKRQDIVKPILLLLLFASPAVAKEQYGSAIATVDRVYDGDTLTVSIAGWPPVVGDRVGVRVYGVDTREMKDGGAVAKAFVKDLLPEGTEVLLSDIQRDKYFRLLARVGYHCKKIRSAQPICQDLSTTLITERYAIPYFGETKQKFEKEIK